MSINKGIALNLFNLGTSGVSQRFIIIVLRSYLIEIAANYGIEKNWFSTLFTCFANKLAKIIVECCSRNGMTVLLWLLVVMSELYENIIARLYLVENSLSSALVDEAARRATVLSMVVNTYAFVVIALHCHTPAALLGAVLYALVGHSRITNHEDGYHTILLES